MASIHMTASDERAIAAANREDIAKLVLRVTVGVLILLHTWAVINGELAIRDTLARWGMPIELAWTAVIFEGIAPIMVILGVYARLGAWMMVWAWGRFSQLVPNCFHTKATASRRRKLMPRLARLTISPAMAANTAGLR